MNNQEIVVTKASIDKGQAQHDILNTDKKINELKQDKRILAEQVQNEIETMAEFQNYKQAKEQFDLAKKQFEVALMGNGTINDMKEEIAGKNTDIRSMKQILSIHLLRYSATFKVKSIHDGFDSREIDFAAKLGKKREEQEELPL